jgi:dienelactone hydrolase
VRKTIYYVLIALVFTLVGWFANTAYHLPRSAGNPLSEIKPTPLDKYTIENLSKAKVDPAQIEIGKVLKDDPKFTSYEFFMTFDPSLSGKSTKKVSGMLNVPKGDGPFPMVVLFRGFVDAETYFIGQGTKPAAEYFAQNGFVTIAPDFFGYADSDLQANDVFESRFQTVTTAMTVLKSASSIQNWDGKNLFIWGHSNGGQIALTTLEITQASYPTVLWAPVSKPFPYSILYFTDSPGDYGKSLRKGLAAFEQDYDTDLYSIHKYFDRIKAPISLNQGAKDENVPQAWSDLLDKTLKDLNVDIKYNIYPGNDHNMRPNWNQAAANSLSFFQKHLQ